MKKQRQTVGERSDARAQATIARAGWGAVQTPARWVARKVIHEDDESTTKLFESDYTLVGLAAAVERREKEERR